MKRITIRFDEEVLKYIEAWRKEETPIPSFNKAVNEMLRRYGVSADFDEEVKT